MPDYRRRERKSLKLIRRIDGLLIHGLVSDLNGMGQYMYHFKDFLYSKHCYFRKPCFVLCFLVSAFFYFLNCAVSFSYLLSGDSD